MIKLYGLPLSFPANKVRFVLNYLGLDYDFIKVDLRNGEHQKEDYLKINRIGKVPALVDGDFSLAESNAIIRYLASKHNSDLYPTELKQRALIEQWLDFTGIHIHTAMVKIAFNKLFAKHIPGMEPNEQEIQEGLNFMARFLPVADEQLAKTKFLTGDDMSIADIALLATIDPAEAVELDLSQYPNLAKWRSELKSKDFYTNCHKCYEDNLMALK